MKENGGKNKFLLTLIVVLLIIPTLSGCMRGELDERLILSAIGVDKTDDNKVKITLALIDTRPTDQQEAKGVQIYTSYGDTIFDAVRATIDKLGKQPIWPYIKIVVLGPSITKDDILPFLDFLNRNNEVQPNPFILVSKTDAGKIINAKVDFASIPAIVIEKQLAQQGQVSYIPAVKLHQFTEMMLSPDRTGYLAIIETVKKGNKQIPMVRNAALIKNAKWIGNLNKHETRGLLWVIDEVKGGILVTESVEGTGKIGLEILDKTNVSIKPRIKRGQLQGINLSVKLTVSVGGMLTPHTALNHSKVHKIEKLAQDRIKKEILSAIDKAKSLEADIFGFGEEIHRSNPALWKKINKNWNSQFPDVPIEVNVTVDIRNLGLFNY